MPRFLKISFMLLFCLPSFSWAQEGLSSFINSQQQQQLLEILDNVCGDSWCEGSYNLHFTEMLCSANACLLNLELDSGLTREEFAKNPAPRWFEASVYLPKTKNFLNELNSDYFKEHRLSPEFYEEVNSAISKILTSPASKSITAPQPLVMALELSKEQVLREKLRGKFRGQIIEEPITHLLKNLVYSVEEVPKGTPITFPFSSYKTVCAETHSQLTCQFEYLVGDWRGRVHVTFQMQDQALIEIQQIELSGQSPTP